MSNPYNPTTDPNQTAAQQAAWWKQYYAGQQSPQAGVEQQWANTYNGGNQTGNIANFEGYGTAPGAVQNTTGQGPTGASGGAGGATTSNNPGSGGNTGGIAGLYGGTSNANLSADYGGWAGGANAAQQQYEAIANQSLRNPGRPGQQQVRRGRQPALQPGDHRARRPGNNAPAAWVNSSGQNLAGAQYDQATSNALAQQVAAMRGGRGIGANRGLAGIQGQGQNSWLAALGQSGQTNNAQLASLANYQNNLVNSQAKSQIGLQGVDANAAYQQAQLQQQQNALNAQQYGQFMNMGQQAQLADLSARTAVAPLQLQQSEYNANAQGRADAAFLNGYRAGCGHYAEARRLALPSELRRLLVEPLSRSTWSRAPMGRRWRGCRQLLRARSRLRRGALADRGGDRSAAVPGETRGARRDPSSDPSMACRAASSVARRSCRLAYPTPRQAGNFATYIDHG